jgi:hypothetical protein
LQRAHGRGAHATELLKPLLILSGRAIQGRGKRLTGGILNRVQ